MAMLDRIFDKAVQRYFERLNKDFGRQKTHSGQWVDKDSPFELVAFRAAINILSQDTATLPLLLYRKDGRGRTEAVDHPLSECLKYPNWRMDGFQLRELAMVSLLTWGNFYAWKEVDQKGQVYRLWPLSPDKMMVYIGEDRRLKYRFRPSNEDIPEATWDQDEILHIRGLSSDGLVGRTPLYDHRQTLGEIAAMEKMSQSFYGNGMKRSGILKHPGTLGKDAADNLRRSVNDQKGADAAWTVLVLEEGMDFSELTFAPEDAQLLDTRRYGVEDACRIFNLPAFKMRINTPGAVSYASVDAQWVDYLVSTLTPWLTRIEGALNGQCLSKSERDSGLFVKHDTRELLRADVKATAEAHKIYREINVLCANEIRDDIGMNPSDDSRADDAWSATYVQSTSTAEAQNASDPAATV